MGRAFLGSIHGSINEGGKWEFAILDTCPFNSGHNRGEARIGKREDGKRTFGCFHESCKGKGWHDLRDLWEPGWRDRAARAAAEGHVGQPAGSRLARIIYPE